jgi:CubicO group peptidase (beta-lactamase class C family)
MADADLVRGHCDARFARVREIFEESFARGDELGAGVAFVLDGETVVDLWGGWCDAARRRPWRRDTIANVYSTTKGLTALCAHQLVDRGLLDLDAPVARYWPEFAQAGKGDLPVRWLLSHEAGLPAVRKPLPPGALYDWQAFTAALAEQEPWWEPGTRHGYHALTFGHLVGELIRRVSGKSVRTFLKENVAGPLAAEVHIGVPPGAAGRVADLQGDPLPRTLPAGDPGRAVDLSGVTGPTGVTGLSGLTGPLGQFLRDIDDPSTMAGAAFNNPRLVRDAGNDSRWRTAEIPAANGHASALGIARVYGALARGGELDGVRLLAPENVERASEEQVFGPDAVLGELPMRFGLGFMLRHDLMPLSPSPRAFGHPGAGGSIGAADPDAKVGFAYVPNAMKLSLVGGPNGFAMLKAFFDEL